MRKLWVAFFLCNLALACFFIDLTNNANGVSRVLPVLAFCESGSWTIDGYETLTMDKSVVGGHYYSDKPPLPSMLVIPFYCAINALGYAGGVELGLALGGFLCGSLPFVLIVLLLLRRALRAGPGVNPVLLAMLPAYGSFLFVFSGTFFGHLSGAAFLLLSLVLLEEERFFWAGLSCGLGFLCDYLVGLAFPLWIGMILLRRRSLTDALGFAAGLLPSVVLIMVYNHAFTGSPFDLLTKYVTDIWGTAESRARYSFSRWPSPKTLLTITLSPYRGLFFFAPFLLVVLLSWIKAIRERRLLTLAGDYAVVVSLAWIAVASALNPSSGGWTYGPRYLTLAAVLLTYHGMSVVGENDRFRKLAYVLSGFGLACAIPAKATVLYWLPEENKLPLVEIIWPRFLTGSFQRNNVLTMLTDAPPWLALICWLVAFFAALWLLARFVAGSSDRNLRRARLQ